MLANALIAIDWGFADQVDRSASASQPNPQPMHAGCRQRSRYFLVSNYCCDRNKNGHRRACLGNHHVSNDDASRQRLPQFHHTKSGRCRA